MQPETPAMFGLLLRVASLAAFLGLAAMSVDVHAQDAERGRRLYENHCSTCHTTQVHGRKNRTPISAAELRDIVDRWQSNQKLRWGTGEVDDVVRYLSNSRYFLTTPS